MKAFDILLCKSCSWLEWDLERRQYPGITRSSPGLGSQECWDPPVPSSQVPVDVEVPGQLLWPGVLSLLAFHTCKDGELLPGGMRDHQSPCTSLSPSHLSLTLAHQPSLTARGCKAQAGVLKSHHLWLVRVWQLMNRLLLRCLRF